MENALLFSNLCPKEPEMTEETDAEMVLEMTLASSVEDPAISNMSAILAAEVEMIEALQEEEATGTILQEIETTEDLEDMTTVTVERIEADALGIADQDLTIGTTIDGQLRTMAAVMRAEDPGQDLQTETVADTKLQETAATGTTTLDDRTPHLGREDHTLEKEETTSRALLLDTLEARTEA